MNRKCFRVACLLAATTVLASCGNDDAIDNGGNTTQESAQVITLAVANTGDNFLATRAARPLYSSAAMQDIKTVKVVIYQLQNGLPDGVTTNEGLTSSVLNGMTLYGEEKSIVAQKVFDPWMNNAVSNEYSNTSYGNGRQASWTLAAADQITEEGVYMAYAVGYNEGEYTALGSSSAFVTAAKSGSFAFPLTIAQNTATTGEPKVCEVFAGSAPFVVTKKAVTEDAGTDYSYQFNVSLTLHRQVAGTIGYFTNIPVKGNADHADKTGTKLRLVASNRSDNAVFAGFNSAYKGGAGTPSTTTTDVKYVVNGYDNDTKTQTADAKFYGSTDNDAYTVYEVTLSDWFKGTTGTTVGMDTNNDGMLNASDADGENWTNPLDTNNKTPGVRKGCVLGSSFLFPFAMDGTKPTFQLQLLSEDGTIIRYWNIRLQTSSTADSQINQKASLVSAAGVVSENSVLENYVNYSILRNHLYNIGSRNAGDGGGNTDPDPSTDDKAQPLNNETLILRVNDNWEAIHEMDID